MKMMARLAFIGIAMLTIFVAPAVAETPYEVWGIDQSNSPGKSFGGTVYVYNGKDLERGHRAAVAVPETIDLSLEASALSTGSTPGIGVIKVLQGGRSGTFEALAPVTNVDQDGVERADIHALTIRLK